MYEYVCMYKRVNDWEGHGNRERGRERERNKKIHR